MLKPMTRAVHFDFHTMPGIDNFGENFDAAKFAQQMADAKVDYINFFARCNIGFSYYPTKIGVAYPGMKGNMLGDVVRECHKRSIGVTGYLNAGLNHELAIKHPEWLNMTKDGKIYNFNNGGNFFRNMCYNTGYLDYFVAEIKEILEEGVDGIFCDCFGLRPCYCMNCIRDMKEQGIDINDDEAVKNFANSIRRKVMKTVRAVVPENIRLFFNGPGQWMAKDTDSHYEVECLPASWGYDFFAPHAAYARPLYKDVLYMNGRFQMTWGDFGGYKGKAAVENDFFDALTQGVIPMLGDHLHPSEIAEPDVYRDLAEIYAKIEKYEKWTSKAKFIPEIAILSEDDLTLSHKGVARMLSELKYTYDIIHKDGDFSSYKLLIIPDNISLNENHAKKLKSYLDNGGKVISTGFSGLNADRTGFILPEWNFEYLGNVSNKADLAVSPGVAGFTTFFTLDYDAPEVAKMRYSQYDTAIRMKPLNGSTSLATEYNSYFDECGWNGKHFVFYTPPKASTGNSVVAINDKQNVAHISFPIFLSFTKAFAKVYKIMVRDLIERFMPDNLIKAKEMPSTSRITLTGNDEYKLLHVKVTYPEMRGKLGIVDEHTELPAGKKLAVKGEYKSVAKLPDEQPVSFEVKDGYTYITLPEIVGYDMFLLK